MKPYSEIPRGWLLNVDTEGRAEDGRLLEDSEGGVGVEGRDHLSFEDLMAGSGERREVGASRQLRSDWSTKTRPEVSLESSRSTR
jgi:hypothetical protein